MLCIDYPALKGALTSLGFSGMMSLDTCSGKLTLIAGGRSEGRERQPERIVRRFFQDRDEKA